MVDNNRLIGVDSPQPIQPRPPQQGIRRPDVSVSESIWQRTGDTNVRAAQQRERAVQAEGAEAQAETARRIQRNPGGQAGEVVDGILTAFMTGYKTFQDVKARRFEQEQLQAEMAEERFEAESSENMAAYLSEASQLIAEAQGQLMESADEDGVLVLQRRLTDRLRALPMTPEDRQAATRWVHDNVTNMNSDHQSRLFRERRDLQAARIDSAVFQSEIDLSTPIGRLAYTYDPAEAQTYIDQIFSYVNGQVQQYADDMSTTELLQFQNTLLENILPHIENNAAARAKLDYAMQTTNSYSAAMAEAMALMESGGMSRQELNQYEAQLRTQIIHDPVLQTWSVDDELDAEISRAERLERLKEYTMPEAELVWGHEAGQMVQQYLLGTPSERFGRYAPQIEELAGTIEQADTERNRLREQITSVRADVAVARATIPSLQAQLRQWEALRGASDEEYARAPAAIRNMSQADAIELQTQLAAAQARIQEGQALESEYTRRLRDTEGTLRQFGLHNGIRNPRTFQEYWENHPDFEAASQRVAEQLARDEAEAQDFTSGVGNAVPRPTPMAQVTGVRSGSVEDWAGVNVPFPAGTQVVMTSPQGQRVNPVTGQAQNHAGIDFGVPMGTPVVAPRSGRVTRVFFDNNGGGNVISLEHADGTESSYLHLQHLPNLQVGSVVGQGQEIGRVGSTGRSTGPHLDIRVRDRPGGNWLPDVRGWLAQSNLERHPENGYTVASMGMPGQHMAERSLEGATVTPEGGLLLPSGSYILNDVLHHPSGARVPIRQGVVQRMRGVATPSDTPINQVFNRATPIQGAMASNRRQDYARQNNPNHNYGYEFFRTNPRAAQALARGADELGIPAQWLADIMFMETGGTFNPATPNSEGAIGLVQFHPAGGLVEMAQSMGVSTSEARRRLARMSFSEQMEYVVQYLSGYSQGDTQFRGRYDTVERLLAAVFLGKPRAFNGSLEEVLSIRDSNVSFAEYLTKLGRAVGRRYHTMADQLNPRRVHSQYVASCPTCQAIQRSGSQFLPHEEP